MNNGQAILLSHKLPAENVFLITDPAPYKNGRKRLFIATNSDIVYLREFDSAQRVWNVFSKRTWDLDWSFPIEDLVDVSLDASRSSVNIAFVRLELNEWAGNPEFTRTTRVIVVPAAQSSDVISKLEAVVSRNLDHGISSDESGADVPRIRARIPSCEYRLDSDLQQAKFVQAIPGLVPTVKKLVAPLLDKDLKLRLTSGAILVGPRQLPHIHKLVVEASHILGVSSPQLYLEQNPEPNAYTLAVSGRHKKNIIVIHTGLVDLLTDAELQVVIAHELGHLACDHGILVTLMNVVEVFGIVPDVLVGTFAVGLRKWYRAAEFSADRASLLVSGDVKTVASVFMKLSGGTSRLSQQLNVDAFMQQARLYQEESETLLGSLLSKVQTFTSTHPLPIHRAREIEKWSENIKFCSIRSQMGGS